MGKKKGSLFGLVEFKGNPSAKRKRAPLGNWGETGGFSSDLGRMAGRTLEVWIPCSASSCSFNPAYVNNILSELSAD